ncbi:unnamed protein product [Moneuplotes crassus]|uniref:Uncharacterized protein n=1 Tax=Euplotes crassus TaxID=5936 RepID=A0AAD1XXK4_EUPCR|nr:unnamed protein product [Moneuplotes crassus]
MSSDDMSVTEFVFASLHCLSPSIVLYYADMLTDEPWAVILIIHVGIMTVLPCITSKSCFSSKAGRINSYYYSSEDRNVWLGVFLLLCISYIVVFVYFALLSPNGYDVRNMMRPLSVTCGSIWSGAKIGYLSTTKAGIEEYFWRTYNYNIFSTDEFAFFLVSIFWALPYVVIAIRFEAEPLIVAIVFVIFVVIGRILIWVQWKYGFPNKETIHAGVSLGLALCYVLEECKDCRESGEC